MTSQIELDGGEGEGGGGDGEGGGGDGEGGGGDGEGGPGTAAAPTLFITQKAESNLRRRAPLGSATFFGCECLA